MRPCRSIRSWTSLVPLLIALGLSAQQNDVVLERDHYIDVERNAACIGSRIHTGLKPVIESRADLTGVLGYRKDTTRRYYWLTELLFRRHLIQFNKGDVHLRADPMFGLELGDDLRDKSKFIDTTRLYQNTRGFWVSGDLGPRVSFQTAFHENQVLYPQYLYLFTKATEVAPGQGRVKPFNGRAYDFGWSMGNVSWSPRGWLNVQLGQGKQFVGHGYRSMILSDNASPYPYLKFSALLWQQRLQYTTTYARLQMLERLPTDGAGEHLFYWKRATFDHLSLTLGRVDVALFEGTIWRDIDQNGVRPFNAMELNPLIGLNTLVNGFKGDAKEVLGLDLRVKLTNRMYVYGQAVTDDPANERFGWQAGLRWFDLFHRDLHLQVEYDQATPFLYAHHIPLVNYAHQGQPLAHPFGAYFNEAVMIVEGRIKGHVLLQGKLNLGTYHLDSTATMNYGGDIFDNDMMVEEEGGPLVRKLVFLDLNASYLLNQMYDLRFTVGYRMRDLTPAPDHLDSGYLYFSLCTPIFDRYYDL
ncbi:MAG: hypothetical protein H6597_02700 [Flavobacteriales bacterium]|nr:hypothetical protein [Flavobacteriales bacterium]MCB9193415.1 hypothetical protein [Flavobacteriales bacterium]